MLRGLDVSSRQDWAAAKTKYGISFGVARCMRETEAKDDTFVANIDQLNAEDLVGGGYTFASVAVSTDAVDDARLSWRYFTENRDVQPTDLFALDLEKSALGQDDTNTWARQWFDEFVRLSDRAPGIYMGSGYLTNRTGEGLREHGFAWLWAARPIYTNWSPGGAWPTSFNPPPPKDRDGNPVAWADCAWHGLPDIWQFAFGPAFDGNVYNGTIEQLRTLNEKEVASLLPCQKGDKGDAPEFWARVLADLGFYTDPITWPFAYDDRLDAAVNAYRASKGRAPAGRITAWCATAMFQDWNPGPKGDPGKTPVAGSITITEYQP